MDLKVVTSLCSKKYGRRISGKWVNDLLVKINNIHTYNELTGVLLEINNYFEVDFISFAITIPISIFRPTVLIWSNCPKVLSSRYKEEGYIEIDPIFKYVEKNSLPTLWRDLDWTDPKAAELKLKTAEAGIEEGFCFPTHGTNGEMAAINFMFKDNLHKARQRFNCVAPFMLMFSNYLTVAAYRVLTQQSTTKEIDDASNEINLTTRERECLLWMAEGKTSWEIAKILDISESTVNAHLANTGRKLQANNRTHAVAIAITQQYIKPTTALPIEAVIMQI